MVRQGIRDPRRGESTPLYKTESAPIAVANITAPDGRHSQPVEININKFLCNIIVGLSVFRSELVMGGR